MRVVRGGSRTTYTGRFTGPAELEMLAEAPDASVPDVARVHFGAGAVTHWHTHPGGQMLYVLEGEARVGTDDEHAQLSPGDLAVSPPHERHWHGAATGTAVVLALTWGTTEWEDVAPEAD